MKNPVLTIYWKNILNSNKQKNISKILTPRPYQYEISEKQFIDRINNIESRLEITQTNHMTIHNDLLILSKKIDYLTKKNTILELMIKSK